MIGGQIVVNKTNKPAPWRSVYARVAIVFLNTFVLLVALNVVLGVVYWISDKGSSRKARLHPVYREYGRENVLAAYPGMKSEDVDQLLEETWGRKVTYEPYSQFKESPFQGRYVNVSRHGFRHSLNQALWPPARTNWNVFVFGGSTTFGYGVSDEHTISSFLQDELKEAGRANVALYNFGRSSYISRQEAYLFQELVSAGIDIDVAVFVDGLNDIYAGSRPSPGPRYTENLRRFMAGETPRAQKSFRGLPILRLCDTLRSSLRRESPETEPTRGGGMSEEACVERYLESQELIRAAAMAYGVRPLFVWQPVPAYGFDVESYAFAAQGLGAFERCQLGYRLMAQRRSEKSMPDLLWCADLHESVEPPLYVDRVHYAPNMNRAIAAAIADALKDYPIR